MLNVTAVVQSNVSYITVKAWWHFISDRLCTLLWHSVHFLTFPWSLTAKVPLSVFSAVMLSLFRSIREDHTASI